MPLKAPLFPEQASTFAPRVDELYFFLVALTVFFSLLIAGLLAVFAIRYRRRCSAPTTSPTERASFPGR